MERESSGEEGSASVADWGGEREDPSGLTQIPYPNPDYYGFLEASRQRFAANWDTKIIGRSASVNDFKIIKTLGVGSYGRVVLVKNKVDSNYYAMKILNKQQVIELNQLEHSLSEKKILQLVQFPFLVNMEYFLKDNCNLYYVMPFVLGGEMFTHLRRMGRFGEGQARFYAAQVVLALEYLHYLDLIFRDLKPENILIDAQGYIRLTDFGFCKMVKGRTYTLCGTPEYMAPEIIKSKGYGKTVDWWALGCLIYEMCCGITPFTGSDAISIYKKIMVGKYRLCSHFTVDLKALLTSMLEHDVSKRFGNLRNGAKDIKEHRWLRAVHWVAMFNRRAEVPYVPTYRTPGDTYNFDRFEDTKPKTCQEEKYAKEFDDF